MTEILLIILIIISLLCLFFIILSRFQHSSRQTEKEFNKIRLEIADMLKNTREELGSTIGSKIVENTNLQQASLTNLTNLNENKLENTRKNIEYKLEGIRQTVEEKLTTMQKQNEVKLEQMRNTVDEKLQGTLEKRLGESFKLVNERLESVYKGLGEMQTLATGVGDLKKVFTNVKSRGYWGEVQLNNILDQFLTADQFMCNVKTKPKSNDFVEFAIKLPGKQDQEYVLLPIDSKFPIEDYKKLIDAEDVGDTASILEYRKKLENSIKLFAKDIYDKYIEPPYTTDFGIMFLPTESLYCEILRNTALCEILQQKYRVTVAGPTTFIALLNSLQMGFKTLAIEKRSSEVWNLLGTIKSEFSKFGDLLDKTNKKLQEVSNTITLATKKTKTITQKLKGVEAMPIDDEQSFYMLGEAEDITEGSLEDNNDEV